MGLAGDAGGDIHSSAEDVAILADEELDRLPNGRPVTAEEGVIGGDQVSRSKPAPDIFLRAAEEFNVSSEKCLVLEDSENGVNAAIKAGMKVIQIPDLIEPSAALKQQGHIILESLKDVINYRF